MHNYLSIISGLVATAAAIIVIKAYGAVLFPKRKDRIQWLAHAICLGSVTVALNAFYWSLYLRLSIIAGDEAHAATLRYYGAYFDIVLRGIMPAWVAYAHLKAKHLCLSEDEQKQWWVWEMMYHPNRRSLLRRFLS